jgi:hypothetical protein
MAEMSELARRIVKRVAELPDRSSPDDWPEAMIVTGDELAEIIDEEVDEVIDVEGDGLTQGERLVNAVSFVRPSDEASRKSRWNSETRTLCDVGTDEARALIAAAASHAIPTYFPKLRELVYPKGFEVPGKMRLPDEQLNDPDFVPPLHFNCRSGSPVKLPPPGDEEDHTKALAAFLEKIGGSGHGGMAEYEIALGEARRLARYTVFGPDVTKEEIVMTGEDGLTEGERRVVNACRIAIREELQRANCADAEPLGGFDDLADFLTPEEARKRFGELYTERGGVRTWREFQGLAGLWKPVFEYADDGINPMPGELRGYKLHVEPDAKPVDDYEGEAVQALSRGQEWPWETILDGVEHALGEGRFDKALRGRFGMSPKPKA